MQMLTPYAAGPPLDLDALARAARAALAQGDFEAAFAFADRRCRLIVPSARDLMLRAQASRGAGRTGAAQRDLSAAMALDPTDLDVDRAALSWGDEAARAEAARRLAGRAALAWPLRRKAVGALFETGSRLAHRLRRTEQGVSGWVAWTGEAPLQMEMSGAGEPLAFTVDADPDHPLSGPGVCAAHVAIETGETGALSLVLLADGVAERVEPERSPRPAMRREEPRPAQPGEAAPFVTVIAPVFEDFEATRLCLDAFEAAPPAIAHELVVVDDASPNKAIRSYIDAAAARGAFTLIRNATNLGFAAAVNKALARRTRGDVLLLNADAALPSGAVDRLHALSRSSPGVGTLTPFSNNGELTSYPLRNEANPMPSLAAVEALDAAAREANGDALVDAPNGVGFCLYITGPCLDSVGGLPELYAQGYYEDVEFCLAARERGFRNVVAPGVFVGHAGSKSFAARKLTLVMRNLQLIEARFPGYRLETAAFVALDPLRPYRAALDAALPPRGPVVIVASGPGAARGLGRRRAEALKAERPEAAVLTITASARSGTLAVAAVGGGAPQSLTFDFAADGAQAFAAYLAKLDVRRVEWLDPTSLPNAALESFSALVAEVDLLCADLNWFSPPSPPPVERCTAPGSEAPCEACRRQAAPKREDDGLDRRRHRLAHALERAEKIVPLDRLAESFALRVFKSRAARFDGDRPLALAARAGGALGRVGVLYPHRAPAVDRLLLRLGRRLAAETRQAELVVFGAALDDAALMATGKIFVVGPILAQDYAEAARDYGVSALLAPQRGGGYGDLEATAAALETPKAYFDWSFGAFAVEWGDLSLDPRICEDKAAALIVAWMNGEQRVQS